MVKRETGLYIVVNAAIGFSFPSSHLNTDVLVHVLRGSVTLMVPLCAVVVPVIPRGALPVHHLQGLQVSGQRGEGG